MCLCKIVMSVAGASLAQVQRPVPFPFATDSRVVLLKEVVHGLVLVCKPTAAGRC